MTDIRDEVQAVLHEWLYSWDIDEDARGFMDRLAARGLTVVREGELDEELLADSLTAAHLRRDGFCSESHRAEVQFVADDYRARLTRQPEGQ